MSGEKSSADVRTFVESVADHKGWLLNRDEEFLADLIEGFKTNYSRYGFFQCPCRDSFGDRAKDKDIQCPCAYAAEDIAEYGQCFCGLFLKPDFYETHGEVDGIPERRPEELFPD